MQYSIILSTLLVSLFSISMASPFQDEKATNEALAELQRANPGGQAQEVSPAQLGRQRQRARLAALHRQSQTLYTQNAERDEKLAHFGYGRAVLAAQSPHPEGQALAATNHMMGIRAKQSAELNRQNAQTYSTDYLSRDQAAANALKPKVDKVNSEFKRVSHDSVLAMQNYKALEHRRAANQATAVSTALGRLEAERYLAVGRPKDAQKSLEAFSDFAHRQGFKPHQGPLLPPRLRVNIRDRARRGNQGQGSGQGQAPGQGQASRPR